MRFSQHVAVIKRNQYYIITHSTLKVFRIKELPLNRRISFRLACCLLFLCEFFCSYSKKKKADNITDSPSWCLTCSISAGPAVSRANYPSLQGRESGLSARAGRTVWALLPEVPRAKPSRAEQRWEGEGDQPQGERHGAAEEREPGESASSMLHGQV